MMYLDDEVLNELLEILGEEDLCAITTSFVEQLTQQLTDLATYCAQAELAETARIAHSLKGGAGNLGANALSDAAAVLERQARAGAAEQVLAAMQALPDVAHQTVAALRERGYLPPDSAA
ncbi:hypothetical protein CKO12_02240 [Chromatium okenii]|uniref:Hpt domain-containing protein n=1 Tax=Chromatium okenii TaxID=61644 RepID=UPI00190367A0|nr:Hpt domain-containing protein [Chromatium okenii]MBK1640717.1 hypothetical protein [Chromatium okenii]